MATGRYVFAALLAAASVPAIGAVTVLGSSSARMCFQAADAATTPTQADLRRCDEAITAEALTEYETVATHVNRGIVRLRRNLVDAAISDFDQAIVLDPRQPEAYLNKGAALMRMDNATEALRLFTVALEYNTRRPEIAHFGRAVANESLGNVRAAYLDYRRASELDPDWQDPQEELRRFRVVSPQ